MARRAGWPQEAASGGEWFARLSSLLGYQPQPQGEEQPVGIRLTEPRRLQDAGCRWLGPAPLTSPLSRAVAAERHKGCSLPAAELAKPTAHVTSDQQWGIQRLECGRTAT